MSRGATTALPLEDANLRITGDQSRGRLPPGQLFQGMSVSHLSEIARITSRFGNLPDLYISEAASIATGAISEPRLQQIYEPIACS